MSYFFASVERIAQIQHFRNFRLLGVGGKTGRGKHVFNVQMYTLYFHVLHTDWTREYGFASRKCSWNPRSAQHKRAQERSPERARVAERTRERTRGPRIAREFEENGSEISANFQRF